MIGLTGSNGAGKSTLRTIAGFIMDHGRIIIDGKVSSVIDLGAGVDYTRSSGEYYPPWSDGF